MIYHISSPPLASTFSDDSNMISEDELPQKESVSTLSSLPDEIIENILARIPKWTYPNLSLVCKRFFALLSSPQLYTTRFNLGTIEPCLYIWIETHTLSPQWFSLSMRPQETFNGNGEVLNDFSLIPVPFSPHSPPRLVYCGTVAVGSDIYVIGGYMERTSSVRILDCRSHTWRDAPNMTEARSELVAFDMDEKIYVIGGIVDEESPNWLEVFDIKTQTWSPSSDLESWSDALKKRFLGPSKRKDYNTTCDRIDGKWKVVREESSMLEICGTCVIDNVMYICCDMGNFMWYDSEGRKWREVKGLERFCFDDGLIQMADYGGKIVIVWMHCVEQHSKNPRAQIWCARIALEKRHKDEIWGKTEWLNTVLEIPKSHYYSFECVVVLL